MKRFVILKWFVILSIVLIIVVLPKLYVDSQVQYSRTARNHVERLLRDKSSTLSRSMTNRVGRYDSVEIEGAYAHVHWRKAMVDGVLTNGHERYWFRIIDSNGNMRIEAITKLRGFV